MKAYSIIKSASAHIFVWLICSWMSFSYGQTATAPVIGDGSEASPFEIASLENLYWISENPIHWNKHFVQTHNIDATETSTWNSGEGWMPIGNFTNAFTGIYNGAGYSIDALYVNRPDVDNQGLFGKLSGQISMLGLTNVNITARNSVGAFAGDGELFTIEESFSTGSITGNNNVGGLVGGSDGAFYPYIHNSYSAANVTGTDYVGGLGGFFKAEGWITKSYSVGRVQGSGVNVGGFCGFNETIVANCYWDIQSSRQESSSTGVGLSTENMIIQGSFNTWDFVAIWVIDGNEPGPSTYPYLQWQNTPGEHNFPKGTESNPYEIATLADLQWLSETQSVWNKHFIQTADIDATETSTWNSGEGWNPIGHISLLFSGTYNGNGHAISNLYINRPTQSYLGFFGALEAAEISNLQIIDFDFLGSESVGGIAGYAEYTTINQCQAFGQISGAYNLGGLVGNAFQTDIKNSFAQVIITGDDVIGGIMGYGYTSRIIDSYSMGAVTGFNYTGGLAGRILVEDNFDINGYLIENSYSTVLINIQINPENKNSEELYNGGLVGSLETNDNLNANTFINYSFWDIENSTVDYSSGGIGKTTEEMKNFITYIHSGWDFKDWGDLGVWNIGNTRNDGFPYHNWQHPDDDPQPLQNITPSVSMDSIVNINSQSATFKGTVVFEGLPVGTEHGFCWNTTGLPTYDGVDQKALLGAINLTAIEHIASGLELNTKYYVRAFALNSEGVYYSDEISFFTLPIQPLEPSFMEGIYSISNLEELFYVTLNPNIWNEIFEQTAHINAAKTKNWFDGQGWIPIGTQDIPFTGSYNGQGHIIDSLYINRPLDSGTALFGVALNATITSLGFSNAHVLGMDNTAILLGLAIDNVSIYSSFSSGYIEGRYNVGGLVGSTTFSTVNDCYSAAHVKGEDYVGGLIGSHGYESNVNTSYSVGRVSSLGTNIGGFVGSDGGVGTSEGNFWDITTSGQTADPIALGLETHFLLIQSTFVEWHFEGLWLIEEGTTYPYLAWQDWPRPFNYPKGTENNPIEIATLDDLKWLSENGTHWGKHYIQTANIDALETENWNIDAGSGEPEGFSPIGNMNSPFYGNYNGNHYTISDLYLKREDSGQGFFGTTMNATISNLGLIDIIVEGTDTVGGLVASALNNTIITQCSTTGIIRGVNQGGGLVGYCNGSSIIESFSTAQLEVSGTDGGGLVGLATNSSLIDQSYAAGSIDGGATGVHLGGLVGYILQNSNLTNTFSHSAVEGNDYLGGLAGRAENATITNSYSTGFVLPRINSGGLLGFDQNISLVSSFYDMETSENTEGPGIAKTTAQMKSSITYPDWQMGESAMDVWGMNPTKNNGYPFLLWQGYISVETSFITDIRGGMQYPVLRIGNQFWMQQNLRETQYLNGEEIPTSLSNEVWGNTTEGAFSIYPHAMMDGFNSDEEVLETFGGLYNFFSITDPRGLCPAGWRIASDNDWQFFMDEVNWEFDAEVAKALKAELLWNEDAAGSDNYGFSAIPGGWRNESGNFEFGLERAYFTSSTPQNEEENNPWYRYFSEQDLPGRDFGFGQNGLSVRCFKDAYEFSHLIITDGNYQKISESSMDFPENQNNLQLYLINQSIENINISEILQEGQEGIFTLSYNASITELAPGGFLPLEVHFNAESATAGHYYLDLTISSDDPYKPEQYVYLSKDFVAEITTTEVTDIQATSATSGGQIINDGGQTITEKGIVFADFPNPSLVNNLGLIVNEEETDTWAITIDILNPFTTYYLRAYAVNDMGTAYGEEREFTTLKQTLSLEGILAEDKVYDGTTEAMISDWGDLEGIETGDEVFLDVEQATANFSEIHVGSEIPINLTHLTLIGADAFKYSIFDQTTLGEILPRSIEITAAAYTKVYGDEDPEVFSYEFTQGNLIEPDELTGQLIRQEGESVGKYIIEQGSLTAGENYTIAFVSDSLVIQARELIITASDQNKIRGEEFAFTGEEYSYNELMFLDVILSVELFSEGAALEADSGEYPISVINAEGVGLENYNINYIDGTFTVNAPPSYTVTFAILDVHDMPLENAIIMLNGVAQEPGAYIFENMESGFYEFSVSLDCFLDYSGELEVLDQDAFPLVFLQSLSGDANSDGEVNIQDMTTIVSFFIMENPIPFCFENADINQDGIINVLDVIGTVQIILNGKANFLSGLDTQAAEIFSKPDGIYLKSAGNITALQIEIIASHIDRVVLWENVLSSHQLIYTVESDTYSAMLYSTSNKKIPAGLIKLIDFPDSFDAKEWKKVIAGNSNGQEVPIQAFNETANNIGELDRQHFISIYPNPTYDYVFVELANSSLTVVEVLSLNGQILAHTRIVEQGFTSHEIDVSHLLPGVYFIKVESNWGVYTQKLIIQKR